MGLPRVLRLSPNGHSLSFKLKRETVVKKPRSAKSAPAYLQFPLCQQKLLRGSLTAYLCLFFKLLNINPEPNRVEVRTYVRNDEKILNHKGDIGNRIS